MMIKRGASKKRILVLGFVLFISAIIFQLDRRDKAASKRVNAALLGEIGDKSAVPALNKTLKDNDSKVRQAAEKAIKKIEAKTK